MGSRLWWSNAVRTRSECRSGPALSSVAVGVVCSGEQPDQRSTVTAPKKASSPGFHRVLTRDELGGRLGSPESAQKSVTAITPALRRWSYRTALGRQPGDRGSFVGVPPPIDAHCDAASLCFRDHSAFRRCCLRGSPLERPTGTDR